MSRKANKKKKPSNQPPRKSTPPPRPVSGVRGETLEDINALLRGVDVPVEETAPVHERDIPPGNTLLLTVADLCALLQVSRSTFFRLKKAGEVPGCITLGGQVRYHRETVETWLRSKVKE